MRLEPRRGRRVVLAQVRGVGELAVDLRDLRSVRLLRDESGAQLAKNVFGLGKPPRLEEVHGASIRDFQIVRVERLELAQHLVGFVGLARFGQQRRVEAQSLAVPGIARKHFLEDLPRFGEAATPEQEPSVLRLEPEVARLELEEVLKDGRRLVELAAAVVHAQEAQERRPVLRIELPEPLVDLLGLLKLAAALEGFAIEEQDGGSVRPIQDSFENARRLLRLVEPQEYLRVRDGALRVGRRELVGLLELGGGLFQACRVLRGREKHLAEEPVRAGAPGLELDGLAGLLLGLRIDGQVAQQLPVFAPERAVRRIQLDGLLELPDGRLELALLRVQLRAQVVLDRLAAAALFLGQGVLRRGLRDVSAARLGGQGQARTAKKAARAKRKRLSGIDMQSTSQEPGRGCFLRPPAAAQLDRHLKRQPALRMSRRPRA